MFKLVKWPVAMRKEFLLFLFKRDEEKNMNFLVL